jgi:predicted nucleotidyltransferase
MDYLNKETISFMQQLKTNKNVLGIVLFGSWARGTQRNDSDVDLLVIVKEGYKRSVEYYESQAFEIIYTTPLGAKKYYKTDLDATYRFWAHAKVLFDRDNTVKALHEYAFGLTKEGKSSLSIDDFRHFEFDALDQLRFARAAYLKGDVATAYLVLHIKVAALTEIYFDTIQEWRPSPKQILSEIEKRDIRLSNLINEYYSDGMNFDEQIKLAEKIIREIFKTS